VRSAKLARYPQLTHGDTQRETDGEREGGREGGRKNGERKREREMVDRRQAKPASLSITELTPLARGSRGGS